MTSLPASVELLREAESLAREAGARLLEGYRARPSVRTKRTTSDLVTELDLEVEAFIRRGLTERFPSHQVVGEEAGGAAGAGPTWYVDPLDGTTNLAHGHPWFCVSIALWVEGSPRVGVVHAPALGVTFRGIRGEGAERDGSPLRVSSTEQLSAALLATGFPADRRAETSYRDFARLDASTHGVRRCAASALELSFLADGAYDGFWDLGLGPWDVAAAILFIEEAGGRVTDERGERFELGAPRIVASNGLLHRDLLIALSHEGALPTSSPMQ